METAVVGRCLPSPFCTGHTVVRAQIWSWWGGEKWGQREEGREGERDWGREGGRKTWITFQLTTSVKTLAHAVGRQGELPSHSAAFILKFCTKWNLIFEKTLIILIRFTFICI